MSVCDEDSGVHWTGIQDYSCVSWSHEDPGCAHDTIVTSDENSDTESKERWSTNRQTTNGICQKKQMKRIQDLMSSWLNNINLLFHNEIVICSLFTFIFSVKYFWTRDELSSVTKCDHQHIKMLILKVNKKVRNKKSLSKKMQKGSPWKRYKFTLDWLFVSLIILYASNDKKDGEGQQTMTLTYSCIEARSTKSF